MFLAEKNHSSDILNKMLFIYAVHRWKFHLNFIVSSLAKKGDGVRSLMNLHDVNIKVSSAEEQFNTIIGWSTSYNDGIRLFFSQGKFVVHIMQVHQSMNTISFFANNETLIFK